MKYKIEIQLELSEDAEQPDVAVEQILREEAEQAAEAIGGALQIAVEKSIFPQGLTDPVVVKDQTRVVKVD